MSRIPQSPGRSVAIRKTAMALALAALLPVAAMGQQTGTDDSTVTYDAAYFTEFSPNTVNDMLDRIPGINQVLNTGGPPCRDGDRGLGSSSSILIDGKRLAGKANEARAQLDRISAGEVNYIQIVRGTSSSLDVQNTGQLVNIVLREAQSRSNLTSEVSATHFEDGTMEPGGSLALSGQRGALTYLVSGGLRTGYQRTDQFEDSYNGDLSRNETIELVRLREQDNYSLNTNLSYDLGLRDRIAFNALYGQSDPPSTLTRTITNFNGPSPVVSFERENIPATAENWELGGDYEHSFLNGSRFKALFIVNEKTNESTRERFVSTDLNGPETKNLFLDTRGRYRERIFRSSYTFNVAPSQGLEIGIEGAQTIQDSNLKLGALTPRAGSPAFGGLTPVALPNANSTVEEIRYEPFAIHNWQISPKMSLESSLIVEFSEIEQTGDVYNIRDFSYVKPKFDLRYNFSNTLQGKATLERKVSQLSFADFSESSKEDDDEQDTQAGNPQLEPEESTQLDLSMDYRLPNDGGTLNGRVFYYRFDNKIGRIDISRSPTQLASTNGNVSPANAYGLSLNSSLRLARFGMPRALLTTGVSVQRAYYTDNPFVPHRIRFFPYDRGGLNLGFRNDVPSQSLNYGINFFDRFDGNRYNYENDSRTVLAFGRRVQAFVEKVWFGGLTYRLEASNIFEEPRCPDHIRFDGYLRDTVVKELEFTCATTGPEFTFKVRGTF